MQKLFKVAGVLTVLALSLGFLAPELRSQFDAAKKKFKTGPKVYTNKLLPESKKIVNNQQILSSQKPNAKIAQVEVYSTDFEGEGGEWTAMNLNVDGSGNTFQWVSDNSNSPTHSWRVSDDAAATAAEAVPTQTQIVSPPIELPTEVEGVPVTSMYIRYAFDVHTPNTVEGGSVYDVWEALIEVPFDGDNLWHTSTVNAFEGSSWFCGNDATGTYPDNTRQELRSPELNLSGATGTVTLTFKNLASIEDNFDFGFLEVSTDGGTNWNVLDVYSTEQTAPDYVDATYDITAHASAQTVLRWRFESDGGYQSPFGWHIDNVEVKDANTTFLFDDGGDTAANLIPIDNPLAFSRMHYDYDRYNGSSTPVWNVMGGNASNFNGTLSVFPYAGQTVRFAIRFSTDGWNRLGLPSGRGFYLDDFVVEAKGRPDNDVTAVNVGIPFPAKVGDPLTFTLNVANTGTVPQSNIQWQGTIFNNATGAQVASVVGRGTTTIAPGGSEAIPSINTWTPTAPGVYRMRAFTRLATDEDRSNDTTAVATDDPNGFGTALHSPFVVHDGSVLFSAALWDAPAAATPAQLVARGFQVNTSRSDPGVVTWQTTASALVPFVNLGVNYTGAYVQFDSLGRPQDEDLIIPNLNFSGVASTAWLTFKALGVGGFDFTRFSVSVSNNGGASWNDIPGSERLRGVDPETGQNYGGPAFFSANMRPAVLNITPWAAGYSNVWIRFRYQAINDADWTVWGVAVSGKGVQAATLSGVNDIPDDQGKQVRVSWTRSPNDGSIAGVPISHYGVWRKIAGTTGMPVGGDVTVVENRLAMISADVKSLKPGARFYDVSSATSWDFIASVLAHSDPDYNYVAPTLADGVETCFMVSAHTANPAVFANSNEACGTSTDDLPPNAPALSGGFEAGVVQLSWTQPDNEEPASYSVYRRLSSEPAFGEAIATVTDLQYQDNTVQSNTSYVYAVTAKDYADNMSVFSNEVPIVTTGVADRPTSALPTEYGLGNNYPNPFNPQTSITFALPENGRVVITILNSLGQEIEKLVDGNMPAGFHTVVWDAKKHTSGVYFYRLTVNNFTQMKKMVLMK